MRKDWQRVAPNISIYRTFKSFPIYEKRNEKSYFFPFETKSSEKRFLQRRERQRSERPYLVARETKV